MRQLDSVINRMQQFHNEEWHSDLEVNILSNLASIIARFNSSDGTANVETQGSTAYAEKSWRMITCEPAQAGNRASKSGCCGQCRDNSSEQDAMTSVW